MKKLFVVLITILGLFFSANAQDPQWLNYNRGDKISSLAEEGNNMWVGTIGGLVKLDKITGISTFYNTRISMDLIHLLFSYFVYQMGSTLSS